MERLFGEPDWHRVVDRPGIWAWRRPEHVERKEVMTRTVEAVDTQANLSLREETATEVELAELAAKVRYYDQLTEAINQAQADRAKVQEEIKAAMGKATVAKLNGVPTFTYQSKETWRTADIKRDMPHLVAQYVRKVEQEVIDWDRFIAHHRDTVKEYQTREFRRVSGTRATRG